jgi:hypothetical protein
VKKGPLVFEQEWITTPLERLPGPSLDRFCDWLQRNMPSRGSDERQKAVRVYNRVMDELTERANQRLRDRRVQGVREARDRAKGARELARQETSRQIQEALDRAQANQERIEAAERQDLAESLRFARERL